MHEKIGADNWTATDEQKWRAENRSEIALHLSLSYLMKAASPAVPDVSRWVRPSRTFSKSAATRWSSCDHVFRGAAATADVAVRSLTKQSTVATRYR